MLIQSCVRLSSCLDQISVAIQVWKPSLALSSGPKAVFEFPPDRITKEEQTLLVQVHCGQRLSLRLPRRKAFYVASHCRRTFTQAQIVHHQEHVAIDHRFWANTSRFVAMSIFFTSMRSWKTQLDQDLLLSMIQQTPTNTQLYSSSSPCRAD